MVVEVIVNNYMLGAKVKSTPVHKIYTKDRIDSKRTKIVYSDVTEREVQLIEKVLARKVNIIK